MTPPALVVIAICLFICLTTDWVVLVKSVSPPLCLFSDAVREEPQLWVCPQSPWVAPVLVGLSSSFSLTTYSC